VDPHHGLDLVALADALQQHPVRACWFVTTLHHPTGATLSDRRKEALVNLLAKHGVPLIEDDVFRELHFGSQPACPAKRYDSNGLVLHCGSLQRLSHRDCASAGWPRGASLPELSTRAGWLCRRLACRRNAR
jgi:DNA-binding transcriptional MocR family regulator